MQQTQAEGKWWEPSAGDVPMYCVALGAMLRRLRQRTNRSLRAVAPVVLNTTANQLSKYESGRAKPTLAVVTALCEAYDANPIELLTRAAMATRPASLTCTASATRSGAVDGYPLDVLRFYAVMQLHDGALPCHRAAGDRRGGVSGP